MISLKISAKVKEMIEEEHLHRIKTWHPNWMQEIDYKRSIQSQYHYTGQESLAEI